MNYPWRQIRPTLQIVCDHKTHLFSLLSNRPRLTFSLQTKTHHPARDAVMPNLYHYPALRARLCARLIFASAFIILDL
jgi:hypothetical protein